MIHFPLGHSTVHQKGGWRKGSAKMANDEIRVTNVAARIAGEDTLGLRLFVIRIPTFAMFIPAFSIPTFPLIMRPW